MSSQGQTEAGSTTRQQAIVWLRPEQADLGRRLIDALDLDVVAAGSGGTSRNRPGEMFGCAMSDDFRRTLSEAPDAALVLLSIGEDERDALTHPSSLARGVMESTSPILTIEPIAGSLREMRRWSDESPAFFARVGRSPSLLASPGGMSAIESLESFGRVRSIDLACRAGAREVSLAALLLDAMEFVSATLGEPESIGASMSGVDAISGLRISAGDSFLSMAGDLTAHLRYSDDRAAAISLSDCAGAWSRGVTLLGPGGCIRFDDERFEWIDPSGSTLDDSFSPIAEPPMYEALAAQQAQRFFGKQGAGAPTPTVRLLEAYAFVEAAHLSARTGQPESPATIRRMAGVA